MPPESRRAILCLFLVADKERNKMTAFKFPNVTSKSYKPTMTFNAFVDVMPLNLQR